jgi:hypothetical protein
MIPASNPPALLSYYLGLFSIGCGLILAPIAFVCAAKGLKNIKQNPALPGKTHAFVGIGCGALGLLVWLLLTTVFLVAFFSRPVAVR